MHRRRTPLPYLLAWLCCTAVARAQTVPDNAGPAPAETQHIVRQAVADELRILDEDGTLAFRFTVERTDSKGTTLRRVVNTAAGAVARLVAFDGKPLNADDEAAERARLQALLTDPAALARAKKRSADARANSAALVRELPDALVFTPVPGQPQRPEAPAAEWVFDFTPNPQYHPPTLPSQALAGITGRVWVDRRTGVLSHLEGRFTRNVDIGFGFVARIYAGGTVVFTQVQFAPGRWSYQLVDSHLTVRELLFRTQQQSVRLRYSDYASLPASTTPEAAVRLLLDEPSPKP